MTSGRWLPLPLLLRNFRTFLKAPASRSSTGAVPGVSWARVVGASSQTSTFDQPLHLQKSNFNHLKNSIQTCISIDRNQWISVRNNMQMQVWIPSGDANFWANSFLQTKPNSPLLIPGEVLATFRFLTYQIVFILLNVNLLICRQNFSGMDPGQLMEELSNFLIGESPFSLPSRTSRRWQSGSSSTTFLWSSGIGTF